VATASAASDDSGQAILVRPLVRERPEARRRPVLVVAAASALGLLLAFVLPRPLDFMAMVRAFNANADGEVDAYNAMLAKMRARQMTLQDAANQLELKILPRWRAVGATLDRNERAWKQERAVTPAQERLLALLKRDIAARDTGWNLMVTAFRNGDERATRDASHNMETTVREVIQELRNLNED
jgi:hypothetical protein